MRAISFPVWYVVVVCALGTPSLASETKRSAEQQYADPERFAKAIEAFEAADKKQAPPAGAILCIGSSSMRGWHETIRDDLAPLTVIPRGFGGSNMNDLLHYAERIVIPYRPRAIVIYEGDNDIAAGISPQQVRDTFRAFGRKVHRSLPETRLYFLAIKPSVRRWALWPQMDRANRLIAKQCAKSKLLTFVDVASGMLDEGGQPKKDIFKSDDLHMNAKGYAIWRKALRPVLMKAELAFEKRRADGPAGNSP